MEIKIGDKVRFLNAVGGGIVKGFGKGGIIMVEDEDGFDYPVRSNEVVVVPADNYTQDYMLKLEEQATKKQAKAEASQVQKEAKKVESFGSIGEALGIESSAGAAESATSSQTTTPREKELEKRIIQLEMTVHQLSLRIERLENARQQREAQKKQDQLERENQKKRNAASNGQSGIIEVDLHANELLDTTAGMSAADIKSYQMKVFRETMEVNKGRKGQRIVFIHGNGEGALRKAIIDELKHSYRSCEYQDASFLQYGFGATMVIVH